MRRHFFKSLLISVILFCFSSIYAQEKTQLTLEDIWASRKFSPEYVYGIRPLANGNTFAQIVDGNLVVFDFKTGNELKTLVQASDLIPEGDTVALPLYDFELSSDETKIIFATETEPIYRHSTRSAYYIFDLKTKKLQQLSTNGKQQLAVFSPDCQKVAFMRDNNLYITNLSSKQETQFTFDGKLNEVINGAPDWVYEEEFSFSQAFFWSGDSKKIAFIRFDESKVKEFQMTYYGELYPEQYKYKYPKAGENNSVVSVKVFNLENGKTLTMQTGENEDIYLPRIAWTTDPEILSIQRLNRHQNHFEVLFANASNGESKVIYEETSPWYVDITDDLNFLPDGESFLITSEKDGHNHIYHHNFKKNKTRQLSNGRFDVTKVYGYNPDDKKVYFQTATPTPMDRSIQTVDLKGYMKPITAESGQNNAVFSSNFSYFVNTHSTINTPYYISVRDKKGTTLRVLKDNSKLKARVSEYQLPEFDFFEIADTNIRLADGQQVSLNAWRVLPPDFNLEKKYPVLVYIYGGPGAQTVNNAWGGSNNLWFQYLAQQGIIVVSVDNRGTGARGVAFKKMTYKELGKYETEDLITTAKVLSQLPYVDAERIGVFGWSYGGYMASLGITKGADYFASSIAVAPVTNWRYYDNIYTERYMQLPSENADGYDQNSPINHVGKMKGKYLLIHGSGDDNVHYQNSMEMINALVKANKPFDLMIYPNRNHGIYGGNTRIHLYNKMSHFLQESLLKP